MIILNRFSRDAPSEDLSDTMEAYWDFVGVAEDDVMDEMWPNGSERPASKDQFWNDDWELK